LGGASPPRSPRASANLTGEPTTSTPREKAPLTKWLLEEGIRLGFKSEVNYSGPEGEVANVAWRLNPDQKPVLTFTVEDMGPMSLAASALQWVGSSTEPKSWIHICILLNGSTDPLSSFPLPRSVRLYDERSLHSLGSDLEELTERMIRLLRIYTDDEPGGDTPEAVNRLSHITEGWPKDMWASRLSLEVKTVFGEGLSLFAAEGVEDEETDTPTLKPSRKVVPVDLTCGDTSFEGALMRLTEAKDGKLLFSTEHRNYPFIFQLAAGEGGDSKLDLWFDVDKSNIPQALRFRELVEGVMSSKGAVFTGPSGEIAKVTLA
jgi:hypothetical protein